MRIFYDEFEEINILWKIKIHSFGRGYSGVEEWALEDPEESCQY